LRACWGLFSIVFCASPGRTRFTASTRGSPRATASLAAKSASAWPPVVEGTNVAHSGDGVGAAQQVEGCLVEFVAHERTAPAEGDETWSGGGGFVSQPASTFHVVRR
jgi:hypothetical protein